MLHGDFLTAAQKDLKSTGHAEIPPLLIGNEGVLNRTTDNDHLGRRPTKKRKGMDFSPAVHVRARADIYRLSKIDKQFKNGVSKDDQGTCMVRHREKLTKAPAFSI